MVTCGCNKSSVVEETRRTASPGLLRHILVIFLRHKFLAYLLTTSDLGEQSSRVFNRTCGDSSRILSRLVLPSADLDSRAYAMHLVNWHSKKFGAESRFAQRLKAAAHKSGKIVITVPRTRNTFN